MEADDPQAQAEVQLRIEGADAASPAGDSLSLVTTVGEVCLPLIDAGGKVDRGDLASVEIASAGDAMPILEPFVQVKETMGLVTEIAPAETTALGNPEDLVWVTFLGGTSPEWPTDMLIDDLGRVHVVDYVDGSQFPKVGSAFSYRGKPTAASRASTPAAAIFCTPGSMGAPTTT